jgi:hypothetical protein
MSVMAVYDALYLVDSADEATGLSAIEVQVLDYLACLISVYDGRSADGWGIGFSVTDLGSPFSLELDEAVQRCERLGWIARSEKVFRLTGAGTSELSFQRTLLPNVPRTRYLEASVSASLAMTVPSIADALHQEPGLRRAIAFLRRKRLLDDTSLSLVSDQFEDLRAAVGEGATRDSLMVPTAVWLTFLAQTADRGRSAS